MLSKKGRGTAKVLGYTFVIFGAVCLARVPTTNSKYVTSSELNNKYLSYNTSFRQISYEQQSFPKGTDAIIESGSTSKIEFTIPRNTGTGVPISRPPDDTPYRDTYTLKPKNGCKVIALNNSEYPGTINGAVELTYNGNYAENISVTLSCPTEPDNTSASTETFLFTTVSSGQKLVTNAAMDVYEKIGYYNGTTIRYENEFLYRSYEQTFTKTIQDEEVGSTYTVVDKSKEFEEFLQWIVKYSNTTNSNNAKLIKDYVENRVKDDIKSIIGESAYSDSNLATYITRYKNGTYRIPTIEGIDRISGDTIEYSINPNLIGYIKTYNYAKSSHDDDEFILYFSIPTDANDTNKEIINTIFENYLSTYVISSNDPDYESFLDYFDDRAYDIMKREITVTDEYRGIKDDRIILYSISKIKESIAIYNQNTFVINANANIDTFKEEFFNTLKNKEVMTSVVDQAIIENSYLHNNYDNYRKDRSIFEYANKGYIYVGNTDDRNKDYPIANDVDYNIDRYLIYNSETEIDKFLLIKIAKENESSMRVSFSDFEKAMSDAENGIGIFTPNSNEYEIYINIRLPQIPGSTEELNGYRDIATSAINRLNTVLNSTTTEAEIRSTGIHIRTGQKYYLEYKYEMISSANVFTEMETEEFDNQFAPELEMEEIEDTEEDILEATDSVSLTEKNSTSGFNNEMGIQGTDKQDAKVSEYSNNKQQELVEAEKDAKTDKVVLDNNTQNDTNNTNKSGEDQVSVNDSLTITGEAQLVS